jgi:transketolase
MNYSALKNHARAIRVDIIKMLHAARSGHPAGALGLADIFSVLYFSVLKHNPRRPQWPSRDRLVLSCGHVCPVLYASLARAGYFDIKKLSALRKINSRLQGHPHFGSLPGIESSSGPLGQGMSVAVGLALAAKLDKQNHYIYCVASDGELNEGQSWEALMSAAKFKLNNLIFIIDRNRIQIDGFTEEIMPLEPLKKKLKAFGLAVIKINGNKMPAIVKAFNKAKKVKNRPVVIVAETIPGKGVLFMENNPAWHGKAPNDDETKLALKELSHGK